MSGAHMIAAQHLAEFVEKASPVATKTALGTGGATVTASIVWNLPDIAYAVGIVGSIITAVGALTFQYLNYRLNHKLKTAQIKALDKGE